MQSLGNLKRLLLIQSPPPQDKNSITPMFESSHLFERDLKKVTVRNKEMIPGKFCFDLDDEAKNQASNHRRAPMLKTT